MGVDVVLTLAGVVGLSVLAGCVWLPLALLPLSVAALLAGLLVDWGSDRGEPAEPPARN